MLLLEMKAEPYYDMTNPFDLNVVKLFNKRLNVIPILGKSWARRVIPLSCLRAHTELELGLAYRLEAKENFKHTSTS